MSTIDGFWNIFLKKRLECLRNSNNMYLEKTTKRRILQKMEKGNNPLNSLKSVGPMFLLTIRPSQVQKLVLY